MNINEYIRDSISGYSTCRVDCPVCYGSNCCSISKVDGYILYFCFRASCGLRGKLNDELSIDTLRIYASAISNNSASTSQTQSVGQNYKIPDHFISPLQNILSHHLLSRYHLTSYYSHNPARIRYDPKLNRLVFILYDHEGVSKGATGRSLVHGISPRWYVYDRISGCPYISRVSVEEAGNVILVEDCISACNVDHVVASIALLGSSISDECIRYLLSYDKLYVALDDDATGKAIKLQKQLSAYKPTKIIQLRKDLKYFTPSELQDLKENL